MNVTIFSKQWTRLALAVLLLAVLLLPGAPALAEVSGPLDVKFAGVIDVVPAAPGDPWQVAGHVLAVDAATQVRLTKGPATPGMWANVTAQRLADGSLLARQIVVIPPEVRLKGPLTAKPADNIGAWTVAGQTIWVTADTVLSERSAPIAVDHWVEVQAVEDPAGTLTAVRVRGIETAEDVEVYGAIQSFSATRWVLSSIPIVATPDTLVLGEPQVGLLAHAAAYLNGDLTARVFRVEWQEPNRPRQPVQFIGLVEALPENGLLGLWKVDGKSVEVLPSTRILQIKGLVQVGARVHVMGWQAPDRVVATQITVLSSPSGPGRPFYLRGTIEGLPDSGLLGTWIISGQQVQVTRQTRISGEQYVRLGAPVEAGGLQYRDGVRVATWVRVRNMSGPGPQPTRTPGPPG